MTNKSNTLILKMFRDPSELKSALPSKCPRSSFSLNTNARCSNIANFPLFLLAARAVHTHSRAQHSASARKLYFLATTVRLVVQELV